MREVERSAASVEEALEAALAELGVSEQEAQIEIVQDPQRSMLGLRRQEAVVRVRVPDQAPMSEGDLEDQAGIAEEFLEGLLDRMGIGFELDHQLEDGIMYVDILGPQDAEGMGLLIGRHGRTLDALQEIVRSAVQRQTEERCRILVDVEDYRKRRRDHLIRRAHEVAKRVKRSGREEALDPMTPFERKVIHDAAAEIGGVETASEGEEPERFVVIKRSTGPGSGRPR